MEIDIPQIVMIGMMVVGVITIVYLLLKELFSWLLSKSDAESHYTNATNVSSTGSHGFVYLNDSPSYKDLLHTAMWYRFREQVLRRDHYRCRYCGATHNLQVHHKFYNVFPNGKKVAPWDYPYDAVITLCDSCHKKWHSRHKVRRYYRSYDVHFTND